MNLASIIQFFYLFISNFSLLLENLNYKIFYEKPKETFSIFSWVEVWYVTLIIGKKRKKNFSYFNYDLRDNQKGRVYIRI